MDRAKIGQLRDHLSRYLDHVRAGGEVLVLDRDRPVARIVPVAEGGAAAEPDARRLSALERRGLLRRGAAAAVPWWKQRRPVRVAGSVLADLRRERESGW